MRIQFQLTGAARKPLIKTIEEITGQKATYSMSPKQYAYIFGEGFDLDKDGLLTAEGYGNAADLLERLEQAGFVGEIEGNEGEVGETAEAETEATTANVEGEKPKGIMDCLVEALNENGVECERMYRNPTIIDNSGREHNLDGTFAAKTEYGEVSEPQDDTAESDPVDSMIIAIPKNGSLSDEKFQNLLKLAESKQSLITKALGSPLEIKEIGDTVQFVFPFNEEIGIAEIYGQLAAGSMSSGISGSRLTRRKS